MFWAVLFLILIVLCLAGAWYLLCGFHRFGWCRKIAQKHKLLSWLAAALPVAALGCIAFWNLFAMIVVVLHLVVLWLLADLAWLLCRKKFPRAQTGICAMVLTAAVLGVGWAAAHSVRTVYCETHTDKLSDDLRICMLADAHLGTTFDGERFGEIMRATVASEQPDLVLICGDFVDDDSCRADMTAAVQALGALPVPLGVCYAPGNHDAGYGFGRDFTYDELLALMAENGIRVLQDETADLGGLAVIGRRDAHETGRASIAELMQNVDPALFSVVLDHQPNDYAAEAEAGADLVLSGHTHGGHIWPAGYVGLWLGMNDRVYGRETRGKTRFLVTSGISGWAIPFKTGCGSEVCIIDLLAD